VQIGMVRILVIEDEPAIADTLGFALTRDGFEVSMAGIAADGLMALRARPFDLVILDVGLPDRSGFEALKELRGFSDVPVIFLTARGDEIDRVVGLEIGADDYVVKPFSVREVVARVQAILRRPRRAVAERRPVASVHGLVLDPDAARIDYHGHALELTRYEYLLLKLLIGHPGRVYSRSQIMDLVWPHTSGTMERTVDAHIKSLRAKLKAVAPEAELIQTHRGFGYSLVAPA
jgi:two-component system catabolic regulation response regulator CreB